MSIRSLLLGVLATVALLSAATCAGPATPARPNVVLIIIDTLRADKLGAYGFDGDTSPELDALAADGVLFERVISQSSWTRPSIGSMLTSLYPRSVGIYKERNDILADQFLTLAESLKAEGYWTFGITANPNINTIYNFDQGFDTYVDSDVLFDWMDPEQDKVLTQQKRVPLPTALEMFRAARDSARDAPALPAYLQINVMEVHEKQHLLRPDFRERYFDGTRSGGYLAAIRQVSHDVEGFVRALGELPGWDNTLFVITSDHGEGLEDHPGVSGSSGHGNLLYESQLWVPLILHHAGGDLLPRRVAQPVRLIDLLPTVLDYAGVEIPPNVQGRSLLGLARGEAVELPERFVAETSWRDIDKIASYSGRWKYIENRDGQAGVNERELQAIGEPENGVETDRIADNEAVASAMREFLLDWEARVPRVPSTQPGKEPSPEVLEQLKSLGYIQ